MDRAWSEDSKYFAAMVVMANHMAPGAEQRHYRAEALDRLVDAVEADARRRRACRDTSVAAATKVRPW